MPWWSAFVAAVALTACTKTLSMPTPVQQESSRPRPGKKTTNEVAPSYEYHPPPMSTTEPASNEAAPPAPETNPCEDQDRRADESTDRDSPPPEP